MAADMSQYETKVNKLFEAFLSSDFQLKSECYLSSLLTHLSGKHDKELGDRILRLPATIEWAIRALELWERDGKPSVTISSFYLNLTALLSRDEAVFARYSSIRLYDRVFDALNLTSQTVAPSLKLAYVKVLSSLLEHRAGVEWLVSNDRWRTCLKFCLANETIYIVKEGNRFVLELLVKTVDVDAEFTEAVVREVLAKLQDIIFVRDGSIFPEIEDEILHKDMRPTVALINHVMHALLHSETFKRRDYRVAELFIRNDLEVHLDKVIVLARNADFLYDLYSILFVIYMFELSLRTKTELYSPDDLRTLSKKILAVINTVINTSQIMNVIKLCHLADSHWNALEVRLPPLASRGLRGANKEPLLFQNQLICLQVMPVTAVSFIHCMYQFNEEDDLRDSFVNTLFSLMCEDTIRMGYNWRTTVWAQSNAFENGRLAIMMALKNIKNYNKRRGIIIFQVFLYNLKDIKESVLNRPTSIEIFIKNVGYCIVLLEAIATFITEYEITWRESLETICVTGITTELISCPFWPSRLVVQGLKLIKLTIARFLPPHLALLIESNEDDNTMEPIFVMLKGKLLDASWEVRDSALEMVYTISNISNSKYPAFQRKLMDLDIVDLVVTMSMSDGEGFVRASAIKCLQEMIQVQRFWSQTLFNQDLPRKMMHILQHETEAIVRTEAACLMRHIHEYQSFPIELMDEIYECMAYSATADLHWEVKSNALDFWGKVILNHLSYQGFIDGKFPTVTFSKENRKIVTLNDREIKSRLSKILDQLSRNGCLSVLINAVQDDCDIEVAKKCLVKMKKLKRVFDAYDVYSVYERVPIEADEERREERSDGVKVPCISDKVIEDILNTNDAQLLERSYAPDFTNGSAKLRSHLRVVTPQTFVSFIQDDLEAIVAQKEEWLNKMDGLNVLLDNMLQSYDPDDVNSMDCY